MTNTPMQDWKIDAFVDGELELAEQLEFETRLRDDAGLRRRIEDARALRETLRSHADRHSAPADWRARTLASLAPPATTAAAAVTPPTTTISRPVRSRTRWVDAVSSALSWRPLAASLSFAALLAVGAHMLWLQSADDTRLEGDVIASHVRSTIGEHLLDVPSSDHHTVKPFLSARLGFSPPVDSLNLPGSVILGGRVDYLDGRPVAAIVYRQGQHLVNTFVWPTRAGDSTPRYGEERGFRTAHWAHAGMTHWVVSDLNRTEFESLVRAVQVVE